MTPTPSSVLVGKVVADRYRLLRPIGTGASAHVYVAEDVRLRRRVALKLLHPALAGDRSFLRRFEAEAQTVAALRHPGIVTVFDWGDGALDGDAYLAMELLGGGSLRAMLDQGHRLSPSQVASVGLDVAAALAHAHSRGLVHRDIKPANILFDEEGHASIADFGIARALAEASWTEPVGALLGTARYAAPEQVDGVPLDGRADVYALVLVLVEAFSGEAPFCRDTTLGALLARAGSPVPVPAGLGPLAPLLSRAGAASRAERSSAEALAAGIARVAGQLPPPAPLPLPGLADVTGWDGDGTELASGERRPRDAGVTVLVGDLEVTGPGAAGTETVPAARRGPAPRQSQPQPGPPHRHDAAAPPAVPPVAPPIAPADLAARGAAPRGRRRRWLRWASAGVACLAVLAGGAGAAIYLSRPAPRYAVPRLAGEPLAAARRLLAQGHLSAAVVGREWDAAVGAGEVISQYPLPGTRLLAHATVSVTVSLGAQPVPVPSLATLDLAQAERQLASAGLKVGHVARRSSMTVPPGDVVSWSPEGRRVLPGTAVDLVVSAGKPTAVVPSLAVGSPFAVVQARLRALGFVVAEQRAYSTSVSAGTLLSVDPAPGSREVVGTTVTVVVSLGPHLVTIPASVVGLSVEQAARLLRGEGIYVYRVQGDPLATVKATEPPVGTAVLYGRSVVLVTTG